MSFLIGGKSVLCYLQAIILQVSGVSCVWNIQNMFIAQNMHYHMIMLTSPTNINIWLLMKAWFFAISHNRSSTAIGIAKSTYHLD